MMATRCTGGAPDLIDRDGHLDQVEVRAESEHQERAADLEHLLGGERDEAEARVVALPRRSPSAASIARHAVDVGLSTVRDELLAFYERFLACGRHLDLRASLRRARARVDSTLADLLGRCGHPAVDVETIVALVALVDGSVVSALVEGDGSVRRRAEGAVTRALG